MIADIEYLFMFLLAICAYFFRKILFRSFTIFKLDYLLHYFAIELLSSLYILDVKALSDK